MENLVNTTDSYTVAYEYYFDYVDPVSFDESELKANKYSIVIAVWVGLAAFAVLLFLCLFYISRTDLPRSKYTSRRKHLQNTNGNLEDPEERATQLIYDQ
ncbi:PREDICTED: melanocortin-2 receptor accessory protein [Nanorana parkeri]|uniref:melanocortin-2 receptor accessory protein n=1 Tax=Nanorana parkeri TaxID=125878 RepID=UPI0008544A4C|nr:PREDICTED: melanocortin-2 receptor accessory protein [Nanorana parkeri]